MHTNDDKQAGASPQIEDGHIKIASEIGEALARINLSAYESRILWVIWRKTYGWHKKEDRISFTQFEKATGMKRRHVQRTLTELIKRNIVTRIGYSKIISYQFQKDYLKWKDITKRGYPYPKGVTDRNLKGLTQKHLTKAINTLSGKKTPDPRIKKFFESWEETFQVETGLPYVFSFDKEGNLTQKLLKVHSLERLQDTIRAFFRDERCKQRGLTIGIFFQEINRLLSTKAMDPLEQAKRELRSQKAVQDGR